MRLHILSLLVGMTGLRVFGIMSDAWLSDETIHRVTGDPARLEHPADPAGPLKIVTWNIERGRAYDAILATLRGLDAQIVLLQEADDSCRRTDYRNVARDLAAELGMNWVAAGEFQEFGEGRRGDSALTGQAILSKFPIDSAGGLRFAAQDRWRWSLNPVQPRRGGRIALRVRTAGLLLYNTHIESGGNRGLQHRQMQEILADEAASSSQMPTIIAGDFNNGVIQTSPSLRSLADAWFVDALGDSTGRNPTSLGQAQPIDWIFVKHVGVSTGLVVDTRGASDHSPVMTILAPFERVVVR